MSRLQLKIVIFTAIALHLPECYRKNCVLRVAYMPIVLAVLLLRRNRHSLFTVPSTRRQKERCKHDTIQQFTCAVTCSCPPVSKASDNFCTASTTTQESTRRYDRGRFNLPSALRHRPIYTDDALPSCFCMSFRMS
jgi:hypothetical protein